MQKALYPEGPAICHATILHPPSGIAGGDALSMDITLDEDSHAVLSTPGANRWYKANGRLASQEVQIHLKANSRLDWLPQENIFFEQAHASTQLCLDLQSGARTIGWEIMQLGSVSKAGHWDEGPVLTHTRFVLDGQPIWLEAGEILAESRLRTSDNGWSNLPVMATLWAFGPELSSEHIDDIGASLPWHQELRAGITQLPQTQGQSLSLIRVLGLHAQEVRQLLIDYWMRLRPLTLDTQGLALRIWNT